MDRSKLIDILSDVEPALAAKELVPVLSHFWFTGKTVMAYNDHIAISTPCSTDFKGAVPRTLLSLLKTSKAKEVEFDVDGENMVVKAATSKFKLSVLPKEDFVFSMPATKDLPKLPVDAGRFIQALEACMFSIGNDTSQADHMGVTLIRDDSTLMLFATDRATISHGSVAIKGKFAFSGRVIMPTDFCKELLRIAKGATELHMEITKEHVYVSHNGTQLFGRLVEPDTPMDFIALLDRLYPESAEKKLCAIPTKLLAILERACIVTDSAVDKTKMKVKVADGQAHFVSVSERGEVSDKLQVEARHPPVSCSIDPKRFRDGYGRFDAFLMTKDAVIMTKDAIVYLVSASGG